MTFVPFGLKEMSFWAGNTEMRTENARDNNAAKPRAYPKLFDKPQTCEFLSRTTTRITVIEVLSLGEPTL